MMKIKAEIIVKGTVQRVGYRDHVQETARKLDVKGYVENLRDGSVKIVCETQRRNFTKLHQTPKKRTHNLHERHKHI